jgi:Zn finger protein HypA/HybF involved in hydrogenase expression
MPAFKTTKQFIQSATEIHKNNFSYDKTEYISSKEKLYITCNSCNNNIYIRASHHLNGVGCRKCSTKNRSILQTKTTAEFVKEAIFIYSNHYNYDKVIYIKSNKKVKIYCNIHQVFFYQTPNVHLLGSGCRICANENIGIKNSKSIEDFIDQAKILHKNKYLYHKSIYNHSLIPIEIFCVKCNLFFMQKPIHHLTGSGCINCAEQNRLKSILKTKEEFLKEAIGIHGSKYNYSNIEYKNTTKKIDICCNKCKIYFEQEPRSHLSGSGCPHCSNSNISKIEVSWLNHLNIPQEYRQISLKIGKICIKTDAYDPETNTVYEFYGDYYHGNPKIYNIFNINLTVKKTFGELYKCTIIRESLIKQAGYNLISIWENDWKNEQKRITKNNFTSR